VHTCYNLAKLARWSHGAEAASGVVKRASLAQLFFFATSLHISSFNARLSIGVLSPQSMEKLFINLVRKKCGKQCGNKSGCLVEPGNESLCNPGLPDFSWCSTPKWEIIYQMTTKPEMFR
jgi:hypothetical protein